MRLFVALSGVSAVVGAARALRGAGDAASMEWGDWIPRESAGWRTRLDYRLEQIRRIESSQERWDAVLNLAVTGLLVPNFTETGYKVVRTPEAVHKKLNDTLVAGFANQRKEHRVDQISGETAGFVPLNRLSNEIMRDLQPLHEEWSGVPLKPSNAYGLRIYRPGNTLTMHTDKLETHVVSAIVHVDRDVDEPWPIVIEGFDGKSVEVDLQPGEMLFYESAKCIHGRPRPLNGRWYTSLFVHYRPADWTLGKNDVIKLAAPEWEDRTFHIPAEKAGSDYDRLRLTGTGYYEPDCPHRWCDLKQDATGVPTRVAVPDGAPDAKEVKPHRPRVMPRRVHKPVADDADDDADDDDAWHSGNAAAHPDDDDEDDRESL